MFWLGRKLNERRPPKTNSDGKKFPDLAKAVTSVLAQITSYVKPLIGFDTLAINVSDDEFATWLQPICIIQCYDPDLKLIGRVLETSGIDNSALGHTSLM